MEVDREVDEDVEQQSVSANAMLIHLVPTCMHQVVPGHPPLRPDSALLHQSILSLQFKVREEGGAPTQGETEAKRNSPQPWISQLLQETIYLKV